MIRELKAHPARWSVRTYVAAILTVGTIGILSACTPTTSTADYEQCMDDVADVYTAEAMAEYDRTGILLSDAEFKRGLYLAWDAECGDAP